MNPPRRGEIRPATPRGRSYLIVSNDRRNRNLKTVLACRITTAQYAGQPTVIEIPEGEGVTGSVVCDDVTLLRVGELGDVMATLSPETMAVVDAALRVALDLTPAR